MTQTSSANLQPSRSLPILPRISSSDSLFLLPHPPLCLIRMLFRPCLFRYSLTQPETLKTQKPRKRRNQRRTRRTKPINADVMLFWKKNPVLDDVVSSQTKRHLFFYQIATLLTKMEFYSSLTICGYIFPLIRVGPVYTSRLWQSNPIHSFLKFNPTQQVELDQIDFNRSVGCLHTPKR